jgi:two-component system, NarL family, sensor histidine kinase DesK
VTNVVRHSRAQHCVVNLGPRWIEIADDGRGGIGGAGNGLTGLRDRVGAAAGTLLCTGTIRGWRVRAEVPSSPVAASIEPADANVTL